MLLGEVKNKTNNEDRYRAALDGSTKGTSSGSTAGVRKGHDAK